MSIIKKTFQKSDKVIERIAEKTNIDYLPASVAIDAIAPYILCGAATAGYILLTEEPSSMEYALETLAEKSTDISSGATMGAFSGLIVNMLRNPIARYI